MTNTYCPPIQNSQGANFAAASGLCFHKITIIPRKTNNSGGP